MSQFNNYHIALIVVLALNLLFWFLVICFRLFFNCSSEGPRVRQTTRRGLRGRRHPQFRRVSSNGSLMGVDNPGLAEQDERDEIEPYNINGGLDAPPTYEDAIKHHAFRPSEPLPPQYVDSLQRPSSMRRPMVYEQPVVLMVPEESTSTSERRLISSLNPITHNPPTETILPPYASSFPAASQSTPIGRSNSQPRLPSLAEEEDSLSVNEYPITFVVEDMGIQAARLTGATCIITELADGSELETHSKA